jgi:hypothetical protein
MYSFDFKSKLQRLNRDLFINEDRARDIVGTEWKTVALCSKRPKRSDKATSRSDLNYLDKSGREYLEALDSGSVAHFICGVPQGWLPERDITDDRGRILARGWRSVVKHLIKSGYTTPERARRVFGSSDF